VNCGVLGVGIRSRPMRVVPELVFQACTLGRGRHEELAATYASTLSQAADAGRGWVGRSGTALSALLGRWQSVAAEHHRLLNDLHDGLYAAASSFVAMDRPPTPDA
jgi:uncharacterized protein YukE